MLKNYIMRIGRQFALYFEYLISYDIWRCKILIAALNLNFSGINKNKNIILIY